MNSKQRRLDAGDMGRRSFSDYFVTLMRVAAFFGEKKLIASITPGEFGALRGHLAARVAPITLCNDIGRIRSLFKYAYEAELLAHPVRFGLEFVKPPKRVMREARRDRGPRLFEPRRSEGHASPGKPSVAGPGAPSAWLGQGVELTVVFHLFWDGRSM